MAAEVVDWMSESAQKSLVCVYWTSVQLSPLVVASLDVPGRSTSGYWRLEQSVVGPSPWH